MVRIAWRIPLLRSNFFSVEFFSLELPMIMGLFFNQDEEIVDHFKVPHVQSFWSRGDHRPAERAARGKAVPIIVEDEQEEQQQGFNINKESATKTLPEKQQQPKFIKNEQGVSFLQPAGATSTNLEIPWVPMGTHQAFAEQIRAHNLSTYEARDFTQTAANSRDCKEPRESLPANPHSTPPTSVNDNCEGCSEDPCDGTTWRLLHEHDQHDVDQRREIRPNRRVDCSANVPRRLTVINACSEDIWIAMEQVEHRYPDRKLVKLPRNKRYTYRMPYGLPSLRFWPKMRCDARGMLCEIGESTDNKVALPPHGFSPPVDSKLEMTLGDPNRGSGEAQVDWWNLSAVDGYTLPYSIELSRECKNPDNLPAGQVGHAISCNRDCRRLDFTKCPQDERLFTIDKAEPILNVDGEPNFDLRVLKQSIGRDQRHTATENDVTGCYSTCGKLTYRQFANNPDALIWQRGANGELEHDLGPKSPKHPDALPYCCPTTTHDGNIINGVSSPDCIRGPVWTSKFVRNMHENCPGVYGFAYDDGSSLQTCNTDTHYKWTLYCPKPNPDGEHPDTYR